MRVIALVMLGVLLLDFIAAGIFFHAWIMLLCIIGTGAVMFSILRTMPRAPRADIVEGWHLGPADELTNPDNPHRVKNAVLPWRFLKLGFLAIGAPGSGKTVSIALGYIYYLFKSLICKGWAFFEGKGDIDIYKMCVAMGQRPAHFFSTELPGSESINLLAGEPQDVIDRLGKILIGTTTSTSFYSDEQRAILTKLLPVLLSVGTPVNLRDLYVVLTIEDAGREMIRRAKAQGLDAVTITLAEQWVNTPIKNRIGNIGGLLNRLFVFVSGPYADRLNCYQPDIDVASAVRNGESIYFHCPLTHFSRDVAIAIIETFGVEARKRQLAGTDGLTAYPLIFDDWGAFFHDGFGPFSARCRSAAMPLSFGFQSRAQLEAVSPTYADELDDTIATKMILRVQGSRTAKYAAELLGEYEAGAVSTSELGERAGSSLSHQLRFRIDPRQLRSLQDGEAYVSTLQTEQGRVTNPLWRLRFPLPPFGDWKSIQMPSARTHTEGEGLSFWTRYMDPAKLADIHAQVLTVVKDRDEDVKRDAELRGRDARLQLRENPGLLDQMEAME